MRRSSFEVVGVCAWPLVILAVLSLFACGVRLPAEPTTPEGLAVDIGEDDAPRGLYEIGPIEVQHGRGCGMYGRRGTYEGAYALLRNEAARMGATYVKITEQIGPHGVEGCFVNGFVIRGILYGGVSEPQTIIVQATSGGELTDGCTPPCSPGYTCEANQCIAVCNPICSPGYVCAQDRTCRPAP